MDEYISRKAALSDAITVITREYGSIEVVPVDALASIPSADVQHITKGKWSKSKHTKFLTCTACLGWVEEASNFCPNCGADMREGC